MIQLDKEHGLEVAVVSELLREASLSPPMKVKPVQGEDRGLPGEVLPHRERASAGPGILGGRAETLLEFEKSLLGSACWRRREADTTGLPPTLEHAKGHPVGGDSQNPVQDALRFFSEDRQQQ